MQSFFQNIITPKPSPTILVSLSCYNKTPQSGWLLNSRNVFLPGLEVEYLTPGCHPGWALVRALFWVGDV